MPVNTDYETFEGMLSEDLIAEVAEFVSKLFSSPDGPKVDPKRYATRLRSNLIGCPWVFSGIARRDGRVVGLKLGCSHDPRSFDSYMGGVSPTARRQGVAEELARRQEVWCRAQGFQFITTETEYDNRAMMSLNLKRGFYVAGTVTARRAKLKVLMEKDLREPQETSEETPQTVDCVPSR